MDALFWVVLMSAALSGFFSLTGHALRSFSRAHLEEVFAARGGPDRLALLDRRLKSLRLAMSFWRALMNLVLVVAMIYLLDAPKLGWARAVGATAAAAGIIAVVGVGIPYAWASYRAEKIIAATLPVLLFLRYACYPVVVVMQAFDTPIRRLSGADGEENTNGENAKLEILQAASDGRAEGAVDQDEVRMIASVIELSDTDAANIMTPRTDIFALPSETSLQEASKSIVEAGHTRVPVFQGDLDNIIGVLYAKDLLKHLAEEQPANLRDIMRKPFFVPETKLLDDLLREFKARKVHMAIVLDEYGGTAGLVSIEDVLEEIVGDIHDEYDRAEPALMRRIDSDSAEVEGRMYVEDLNEAMGLKIPEDEDYDTVAGFLFSELGFIPSAGEKLLSCGARFTILTADERKITSIRVEHAGKGAADVAG